MKLFLLIIFFLFLNNCSFDNKTGIWENKNDISSKQNEKENILEGFEKISSTSDTFDKVVLFNEKLNLNLPKPRSIKNWDDIFLNGTNNSFNINYTEKNELFFKSKKITKKKINDYILFWENHLITSDEKGNLIIFSIKENKVKIKFNFYKKRYKNLKKYLNLHLDNNIIYVSDNIGYLYAFDLTQRKIIWAKDYKIPFRGNLKLFKNKLIASNQNNSLIVLSKFDGELLSSIPTEETIVKNEFRNNISINDKMIFFVNTFGSVFALDNVDFKINWFLNVNETINLTPSDLFNGSEIINYKDKLIVSSKKFTYVLDTISGSILYKINFSSEVRPIVINDYLILVSRKGFLISFDLIEGKIIFSSKIKQNILDFSDKKKFNVKVKKINILQNKIYIFLENSSYLIYNFKGEVIDIKTFPSKINSQPIFINNFIYFLDKKNRLSIIN